MNHKIEIIPSTIADYPTIQNLARFYVYAMAGYCGKNSPDWAIEASGLYECFDFKKYFVEENRKAYLIKVNEELAGFILIHKTHCWNIGEFFIISRFQGEGVGKQAANLIFEAYPGKWEVSIIPENLPAQKFWRKTIKDFKEKIIDVTFDRVQPKRHILSFDNSQNHSPRMLKKIIIKHATKANIPAMVELSYQKRKSYEQAQPRFWRYASGAEEGQTKWFEELLDDESYIMLVATELKYSHPEFISGSKNEMLERVQHDKKELKAFIIGRIIKAPEVYNPGGLTLMIDDFCVAAPELWETVGSELVAKIKEIGNEKGAAQILVVSGDHDAAKNQFLESHGLSVASRWYVGEFTSTNV